MAIVAGFVPIQILGEMTSIGTLFAFVVVSLAVIILRVKRPDAHRPFKVPGGYVIPVLGVLSCVYLMVSLSVMTWVRFLVWLDFGMVIYWFYGRTHSPLVNRAEARGAIERREPSPTSSRCSATCWSSTASASRCWRPLTELGRHHRGAGEVARARRLLSQRRPAHQPGDCRPVRPDDSGGRAVAVVLGFVLGRSARSRSAAVPRGRELMPSSVDAHGPGSLACGRG